MRDYRNSTSLLKCWAPYSDFAVGVIPKGAKATFKVGMVAPKTFPSFHNEDENFKVAMSVNLSLLSSGTPLDVLKEKTVGSAHEALAGGAMQFYVHCSTQSLTYNVGKILKIKDTRIVELKKQDFNKELSWWENQNPRERDKLYLQPNSGYDDSEIDVVSALAASGIIDSTEKQEFEYVMEKLSCAYPLMKT